MWTNNLQTDSPQITIHCRSQNIIYACRTIQKRTQRHAPEYVIFIVFERQKWLHERASLLPYTHIGCLLYVYDPNLIPLFLHLSVLWLQSPAQMLYELIGIRSLRGMVNDRRTRQQSDRILCRAILTTTDHTFSTSGSIWAQSLLSRRLNPGPSTSFFELKIRLQKIVLLTDAV